MAQVLKAPESVLRHLAETDTPEGAAARLLLQQSRPSGNIKPTPHHEGD